MLIIAFPAVIMLGTYLHACCNISAMYLLISALILIVCFILRKLYTSFILFAIKSVAIFNIAGILVIAFSIVLLMSGTNNVMDAIISVNAKMSIKKVETIFGNLSLLDRVSLGLRST